MNKKAWLLNGICQLPEEHKAISLLWAFANGLDCFPQASEESELRGSIAEMLQGLDKEALERVCCLTQYLYLNLDEEDGNG